MSGKIKTILPGTPITFKSANSNDFIVGTGAVEKINVQPGVKNIEFTFGRDDQVKLPGNLADYSITATGNRIFVKDGAGDLIIGMTVGGTGKLEFANGVASLGLDFAAGGMVLGGALVGATPVNPNDVNLEDPGMNIITHDMLLTYTAGNPFQAGDGAYKFLLDASKPNEFHIHEFGNDDVFQFRNSPTGTMGDFYVDNPEFFNGQATVGAGSVEVDMTGLINDFFFDSDTFIQVFGVGSLEFV